MYDHVAEITPSDKSLLSHGITYGLLSSSPDTSDKLISSLGLFDKAF